MRINEIVYIDTTDSTNEALKREIDLHQSGYLLVASSQTKGKGQRGKTWDSVKNEDLTFSIYYKNPANKPEEALIYSTLSIVNMLSEYGINADIKLPNDILVGNDKIAGILIENIIEDKTTHQIIGIGINVNSIFTSETPYQAVSMAMILHEPQSLSNILEVFCKHYNTLTTKNAFNQFKKQVLKRKHYASFNDKTFELVDITKNFVCELKSDEDIIIQPCTTIKFTDQRLKMK